ncbi:MAG: nitrite reductase [Proteobacteria bacterium]|nr:nitrite reductase [Pseudomonadota bacterium]MBU1709478.1 nitrite reductase [Pseudomonadota bacterium]
MKKNSKSITIALTAGRLPLNQLELIFELARQHGLGIYLTTLQNVRLTGISEESFDAIKARLVALGAVVKRPGLFPVPRVCVGSPHCKLALIDTEVISQRILDYFSSMDAVKPKLKIAVSACPASCSGTVLSDIGIMATRSGYDVYAGGMGGPMPRNGRRVLRRADEAGMLAAVQKLIDFHQASPGKKKRMRKLIDAPDFPFKVESDK